MVDPKLGAKRNCVACEAKFYDLNKSPVVCPKCDHSFDPMAAAIPDKPVAEIEPTVEADAEDEEELEEDEDAISLDDIDEDDDDDEEDEALGKFVEDEALLDDDDEDEALLEDEDEDDIFDADEDDD